MSSAIAIPSILAFSVPQQLNDSLSEVNKETHTLQDSQNEPVTKQVVYTPQNQPDEIFLAQGLLPNLSFSQNQCLMGEISKITRDPNEQTMGEKLSEMASDIGQMASNGVDKTKTAVANVLDNVADSIRATD